MLSFSLNDTGKIENSCLSSFELKLLKKCSTTKNKGNKLLLHFGLNKWFNFFNSYFLQLQIVSHFSNNVNYSLCQLNFTYYCKHSQILFITVTSELCHRDVR